MSDDEAAGPAAGRDEDSEGTPATAVDEVVSLEPPVEPGSPSPENVLFFLLGVLLALAVVYRLFQLFG